VGFRAEAGCGLGSRAAPWERSPSGLLIRGVIDLSAGHGIHGTPEAKMRPASRWSLNGNSGPACDHSAGPFFHTDALRRRGREPCAGEHA
jgi:hypothetical protein